MTGSNKNARTQCERIKSLWKRFRETFLQKGFPPRSLSTTLRAARVAVGGKVSAVKRARAPAGTVASIPHFAVRSPRRRDGSMVVPG